MQLDDGWTTLLNGALSSVMPLLSGLLSGFILLLIEYFIVQPLKNRDQSTILANSYSIKYYLTQFKSESSLLFTFLFKLFSEWKFWLLIAIHYILKFSAPAYPSIAGFLNIGSALIYVGLVLSSFSIYKTLEQDYKRLSLEHDSVKAPTRKLHSDLAEINKTKLELESALEKMEVLNQSLKDENQILNADLSSIKKRRAELRSKNSSLQKKFGTLIDQVLLVPPIISELHAYLPFSQNKGKPSKSDVEMILDLLVVSRETAIGFKSEDLYNFAVYLFNKKTNKLDLYARRCHKSIKRHDRSWESNGTSHTAKVYSQGKAIISGTDVTDDGLLTTVYAEDLVYYASFISAPILDQHFRETTPIGVFTVTTNQKDFFRDEHSPFVEIIASLLSLYFSSSDTQKYRK